MSCRHLVAAGCLVLATAALRPAGDDFDRFIQAQMARRQIAALSLAIVHGGRVVDARAYGTTTRNGRTAVTTTTLFQAGSVSKPVSALGPLRLVDAGKLSLDEDVNAKLRSWRVPDNDFTTGQHVTLRRLLSHTAGLTVSGFAGYEPTERTPSVPDVLDGRGNSPAVRVDAVPGSIWRYSGGGYTVMQQLVEDVSGKPFATYMGDDVLKPLGMTNSTFQQPLPPALGRRAATGHFADRSPLPGGWHVYPEKAAAGLWTTPTDLAKYIIGVQRALAGKSNVWSAAITRQMLTEERAGMGLGPAVHDGASLRFSHNGRNRGFDTLMIGSARAGDGLVVMINGNDNTRLIQGNCCQNRIATFIARRYNWPDYEFAPAPEPVQPVDIAPEVLSALAGRYEFANPTMMALGAESGRLFLYEDGLPDEDFVPAPDGRFVSTERAISFRAVRSASGDVEALEWTDPSKKTRRMPRLGPLFSAIRGGADDPDPAFTRNVLAVVHTLAAGGKGTAESSLLTAGARTEFSPVAINSLQGARSLSFLHRSDVGGRGLERLGHPIQRVLHYRMETDRGPRWLLVDVDPNGLIADFDVVVE